MVTNCMIRFILVVNIPGVDPSIAVSCPIIWYILRSSIAVGAAAPNKFKGPLGIVTSFYLEQKDYL